MSRSRILTAAVAALAAIAAQPSAAQDKSASSVIQLPSAGGTVTREEGSFTLNNNTGSANFNLPLPELPQRGKFGPQIRLSYNQFAGDTGNGLGIGWRFTVPAVMVNDDLGTAIPGTRPEGDFFSHLDYMGARLIFQGETAGLWEYKPEFSEEFTRILYHPGAFEVAMLDRAGNLVTETISSGFEVIDASGNRMIFSGDPSVAEGVFDGATQQATKWPLVLQLNPNRDAVRYQYEKFGGRSYLTRVSFAGGQSVYDFELIDTQGTLVSHANGTRQRNEKLYGKVSARFGDTIYGQWCMGYIGRSTDDPETFSVRAHEDCLDQARTDLEPLITANSINVLDQLRILYRFGDTDGAALTSEMLKFPDIRFDYSSWTAAELAARQIVFEAPQMDWTADIPPQNLELADLNMDALVDVIRTSDDGATVFLGEGDPNAAFASSKELVLTRSTDAGLLREVAPRLADNRFHFADVFGDSFVDIVEVEEGILHLYDGKADGSFPYLGRSVPLPGISPATFAAGNGRFTDLNMDGLSDIVTTRLNDDGRTEFGIFLNLTRRQEDGSHLVNFGVLSKPFPFDSQDGQILSRSNVRLTDVNGDRLPDLIVIRPADQGFCLYENQGNLFSPDQSALLFGDPGLNDALCGKGHFAEIGGMQPTDRLDTMWYVDANGDGILDFASMGDRTDQLRVWLGFGDGTYLPQPLNIALNLRVQVGTSASFRSRVADLDADGQSEIIVFQQPAGNDVKPVVVIDFNRTETMQLVKANLLTVVDFASGRRHDIRYATSIDEMLRDRANGRETTHLHFPVVIAKQMVTSEGVPGQTRTSVQAEEFFYHNPFYDVLNKRFIGFGEVAKVVYGDEFLGDRATQQSAIVREQYYTFAELASDLHLAGKLKIRTTHEVLPDPVLLASAEGTIDLNPGQTALHSLSTETRSQRLPRAGALLRCESQTWETVPNGTGTAWLRKVEERLTESAGPQHEQDAAADACVNPSKNQSFSEFDEFNLAGVETVLVVQQQGPSGLTVPQYTRTTQTQYGSRDALAPLGIVDAATERRVLTGTRLLSRERFTYLPEAGGRLGSRALDVFSGLGNVPADLSVLHTPMHSLTKVMDYDLFGNVISMSDDFGIIEAAGFDETGTLPLSHTRFAGGDAELDQLSRMTYDGPRAGAIATETTPLGMVVSYEYDALGRKTAERAEDGAEKLYFYKIGEAGRPSLILTTKRRYPSAAETPAAETQFIDELEAYNARGNPIASVENRAEGGVRVINFALYNRNEKLVFNWTPYVTDSFNGATGIDLGAIFEFGDVPRPEQEIGTSYVYDAAGRVVHQADPSGLVAETTYAPWGTRRVAIYGDQFNGIVRAEELRLFNENGVVAMIKSDGQGTEHVSRFVRDSFGYLREIWLPGETEPRRLIFNSIGDLEFQSVPGMGDYYAFYDQRGRQSAVARVAADGESSTLAFAYDHLNRKLSESENGNLRYEFIYDRAVQLASLDPDGAIVLPLDNITQVISHDPNGLFDATQRFAYNANGRMIANEMEIGGESFVETYHHTLDGRIDASSGPRGLSAKFALGPDRNLKSVTISHPDLAAPETVISNIAYSAEGKLKRIDYRNGAFTEMTYNPETLYLEHILSEAGGFRLQDLSMTFNQIGSITEIVDALAGAGVTGHVDRSGQFHYDFKNQLVEMQRYGETSRFGYSAVGTFTRNDEFAAGVTLTPDTESRTALLPAGTPDQAYSFDGFGQIAGSPRLVGTVFDANGRLLRAQTETRDVLFGYDQTGRRLYKRIVTLDGSAEDQVYLYPIETFERGPKGDESFVNIGNARLVRLEHGTGRWFYYLKDHLESSDYVIASDGRPVEQMLYRAYGTEHQPEALNSEWGDHVAAISGDLPREKTHHRFTGQYLDDTTGLYYFGARYYDPGLGRFVSPDPLYLSDPERCVANAISCNLFAYANNNPMAFIDPTGLDLVVGGDEAYRRQTEEHLQRIDPTARVDRETGVISQNWLHGAWLDITDFFSPGNNFETGRELVSRIIESDHVTLISNAPGRTRTVPVDPTRDITADPGDVAVLYDPTIPRSSVEFDPAAGPAGTTSVQPADPGIVLGHELIHATHMMAGTDLGDAVVNYRGRDGSPQSAIRAELQTVGVGGLNRPDDITENNLREMLGINPRNHY